MANVAGAGSGGALAEGLNGATLAPPATPGGSGRKREESASRHAATSRARAEPLRKNQSASADSNRPAAK